jgi:hypothetical protein
VYFCIALCVFLLSGSATATIRSGSLTFNHSPHSTKSKEREEENEKRVTSQGYNKTAIFVRFRHSYRLLHRKARNLFYLMIIDEL